MSLAQAPVGHLSRRADPVLTDTRPLWFRKHCHVWCLGRAVLGQKTKAVSLEKRKNLTGPRPEGDEDRVREDHHWAITGRLSLLVGVTQISPRDPGPLSAELASKADVRKVQPTLLMH